MTNWISVKDRLPENWQEIIFAHKSHVSFGYFYNGTFKGIAIVDAATERLEIDEQCAQMHVSHWMPLPDAPAQETEIKKYAAPLTDKQLSRMCIMGL